VHLTVSDTGIGIPEGTSRAFSSGFNRVNKNQSKQMGARDSAFDRQARRGVSQRHGSS
jgi:signal transduction histidine kinase